jgi:quinoprotein glucose dehydrogenase
MKISAVSLAAFLGLSLHAFTADVSGGGSKSGELKPADRAPVHPPKDTKDAAAKNFTKAKLPEGFTGDIWASEPLLANPVAFCFDGKGRMFVSETHRYRTSVLDIRHYYWMVEDDLASRNQDDWMKSIKKNFPKDWQNLEKESELVRLVQDSNGDGKADQSSVYADGFNSALDGIASGVLWHNDALYFTNIPALWKMTGADKAEKKEELHRGYGVRFSYTGHDFHGLIAGPDGRLYFSIGDRGSSIKTKEGTTIELPDEGAVFRCEPDGSHLEVVMRGLRNPQELAFDDYGNLFTGDNDSDQGDRERWVLVTEGADAGWRVGYQHHLLGKEFNPWLAEAMWEPRDPKKHQPAYILSPIANLPDGPSGLVHYPGTGFPAEYAGSFFLCGFKGSTAKSQVNTFKTEPDGAGFKLVGLKTFMDNVQATDVDFGPDSRMYVSAWDEGWERSDQGRIYRLSHEAARKEQAAQIAEVQKILGEGFKQRTAEELVNLLAHADQRVRLGAQWELAGRENGATFLFQAAKRVAASGDEKLARIHGLFGMSQFIRRTLLESNAAGGKQKPLALSSDYDSLYEDEDPNIRATMIWLVGEIPRPIEFSEQGRLRTAARDESPRVRAFAALAIAKKGNADSLKPIIELLADNDGKDQYIQEAGVTALAGVAKRHKEGIETLANAAKGESRAIRLAALLAYRKLTNDSISQFLADKDPSLVREAVIAINDAPIPAAMPAVAKLAFSKDAGGQVAPIDTKDEALVVRVLNANFRVGGTNGANSLALFAARSTHESLRGVALKMLTEWAKPPQRDYITGTFRPLPERGVAEAAFQLDLVAAQLLGEKSEKLLIATCEALAANDVKKSAPHVLALLRNDKAPQKARLAALNTLAKLATPELDAGLIAAGGDANPALKTAASKLMGKRSPDAAAQQLTAAWAGADASQKQDIASALGETKSAKSGEFLAKLVTGLANEPAEARLEILEAAAKHDNAKAAVEAYEKALKGPFEKYDVALSGGDKDAGEKLFKEHPVAACLRCHKVSNSGGDAGPDLTGFAAKHDRAYILESIVNVNAKIAPGFQMVILTMKDGSIKAGALKSEENGVLTIQNPGMPAEQVKAAEVTKRDSAPSGMIPNLPDLLTKRELRDIVEYVSSLK